jgi:hypothetical protein
MAEDKWQTPAKILKGGNGELRNETYGNDGKNEKYGASIDERTSNIDGPTGGSRGGSGGGGELLF